ncbi:MAG: uroporphyrinogen decarboxylase family protein [Candidatus Thorarchaeota archaeon]
MTLSKRERVIRTFELEEPDKCPIYYLGFEPASTSFQHFIHSDYFKEVYTKGNSQEAQWLNLLAQYRFFNSDIVSFDPFVKTNGIFRYFDMKKFEKTNNVVESIGDQIPAGGNIYLLPNGVYFINVTVGRLWAVVPHEKTGMPYRWYLKGLFTTPEIMYEVWNTFGKPSELVNEEGDWSSHLWEHFLETLSPYFYPMANIWGVAMHEGLLEGMGFGKVALYMRKKPEVIHDIMREFTKHNIKIIKRFAEAGVDCVHYWDDLGQKGRSILSLKNFKEFILPYFKEVYQTCKKNGMFVAQHADGYIDDLAPYLADAGLNCLQSLEPASGVNLTYLKETLGDRISFMGGMDSSRILNFGTAKEIEEDVRNCIKIAAPGGGYFAGPSHNILDCPFENLLTLRKALEKYRKYPINV